MRKFLLLTGLLLCFGCGSDDSPEEPAPQQEARTQIPDANFEAALVDLELDNTVDGSVRTAAIEFVTDLILDDRQITSLSGIADFQALINLSVRNNNLTNLDVSNNTNLLFIWAENNQISSLNIGINPDIEKVGMSGNRLESIDVADYPQLQLLTLADNLLGGLNVSTCPDLLALSVEGNPLDCILVSPDQLGAIPPSWTKDEEDSFSLDCQ